jgi:hypothetical protein
MQGFPLRIIENKPGILNQIILKSTNSKPSSHKRKKS